tara:strand:- start:943 stop:1611 length:669 start_codon:yes stop_codon:yes gene_type:complete
MFNQRYQGIEKIQDIERYTFHIMGCGAIGSSAATQLARMGATHFRLYDMDKVEDVNIGVSMYDGRDIGKNKVSALKDLIDNINPFCDVITHNEKFHTYYHTDENDVIILGFDSMEARMDVVEACTQQRNAKPLFIIDGRMGAEHYQQYFIANPTKSKYEKIWYSDEEGSQEPCNRKATAYCTSMCGAFITNTVRKVICGMPYQEEISFHFPDLSLAQKLKIQ